MSTKKPTIVFIPGLSSTASLVYAPLITQLQKLGYQSFHPLELPSINTVATGASLKPNALEADIAAIRSTLCQLIEEEQKKVILVAHSYGGTPALSATEGLWKENRTEEGKVGGIIKACLISSSLCFPGDSIAGAREAFVKENPGVLDDGAAKMEVVGEETFIVPEGFETAWFNDLPPEEMQKWGQTLKPTALGAVITPVPLDSAIDVTKWKISYLVAKEKDLAMPEAAQKSLIEKARERGVDIESREIVSGHFVQVTHAEEVAGWIDEVAGGA
ncbi:alpha/beta-hydrolase [Tothia fuscella]|uniref:Alpha/beta-hydrolase n=1 Tax=Tothia fuscella TaxID=1048955 RepID=A0A9P4U1K0_9PEZI|nr:alpha/beta-hydrolase [Tothia fuscella]